MDTFKELCKSELSEDWKPGDRLSPHLTALANANKKFVVSMPSGLINENVLQDARRWINVEYLKTFSPHRVLSTPKADRLWMLSRDLATEIGLQYHAHSFNGRRGKFCKRLRHALADIDMEKADADRIVAKVGEMVGNSLTSNRYLCDMDRDIDWRDGDFGDEGSCIMQEDGEYDHARDVIADFGAAFRTYGNDSRRRDIRHFVNNGNGDLTEGDFNHVYGRCWIAYDEPKTGFLTAFNVYGLTYRKMMSIIGAFFGFDYLPVYVNVEPVYTNVNKSVFGHKRKLHKWYDKQTKHFSDKYPLIHLAWE